MDSKPIENKQKTSKVVGELVLIVVLNDTQVDDFVKSLLSIHESISDVQQQQVDFRIHPSIIQQED